MKVEVTTRDIYKFALDRVAPAKPQLEVAKRMIPPVAAMSIALTLKYGLAAIATHRASRKALKMALSACTKAAADKAVQTAVKTAVSTAVKAGTRTVVGTAINPYLGVVFTALMAVDVVNSFGEVATARKTYDSLLNEVRQYRNVSDIMGTATVNARVWEVLTLLPLLPTNIALFLAGAVVSKFTDGEQTKVLDTEDPESMQDFLFEWVTLASVNSSVERLFRYSKALNEEQGWASLTVQTIIIFAMYVTGSKLTAQLTSFRRMVVLALTGVYNHYAITTPPLDTFFDEGDTETWVINWDAFEKAYYALKSAGSAVAGVAEPYMHSKAEAYRNLAGLAPWSPDGRETFDQEIALDRFVATDTLTTANNISKPAFIDTIRAEMRADGEEASLLPDSVRSADAFINHEQFVPVDATWDEDY